MSTNSMLRDVGFDAVSSMVCQLSRDQRILNAAGAWTRSVESGVVDRTRRFGLQISNAIRAERVR